MEEKQTDGYEQVGRFEVMFFSGRQGGDRGKIYGYDKSCFYSDRNAEDDAFNNCVPVFVMPVFGDSCNSGVCGRGC